jgi:hypothetical protein
MAAAIVALIVVVLLIAVVSSGGGGSAKPPPARPHVAGVTAGGTPAEQAHNLARWIRQHSR